MKLDHSADFKFLLNFIVPQEFPLPESSLINSNVGQLTKLRLFKLENIPNKRLLLIAE